MSQDYNRLRHELDDVSDLVPGMSIVQIWRLSAADLTKHFDGSGFPDPGELVESDQQTFAESFVWNLNFYRELEPKSDFRVLTATDLDVLNYLVILVRCRRPWWRRIFGRSR